MVSVLSSTGSVGLALRVVDQFTAAPWARELDLHELGETRTGPARHQGDPVGEQDRLVDVVGHHEDGVAASRPHPHQLVLDDAAGERVDLREGLVEQQHFGLGRERAREPDALSHAAGECCRALRFGAAEPDRRDPALHARVDLGAVHVGIAARTASRMFSNTVIHGISEKFWKTTIRSMPGPAISRPPERRPRRSHARGRR